MMEVGKCIIHPVVAVAVHMDVRTSILVLLLVKHSLLLWEQEATTPLIE